MKRPPVRRLLALFLGLVLALGAIVVRLTVLQVNQADAYQTRALDQRLRSVTLPAGRGQILDRSGEPLAISTPARDVYADPRYVDDPWAEAARIAPILGMSMSDVAGRLTSGTTFSWVARQVDLSTAERLEALRLPGIGFLPTTSRSYPAGALAAQLLGFVDIDGAGIAGLELRYQDELAGTPGERTQEIDPNGQPITGGIDVERAPVPGSDLVLTIDRDFQYQVQEALRASVEANHAAGGTVVVMDPRTGDVYAMATYPWFDPNDPAGSPEATWRARAVTDAYEPGSVNKVVTVSAALQEGAITTQQRFRVPWTMRVGDYTIHDSHPHPVQTMTVADIVAESSNIGAVEVARRLGESRFAAYLARFGLGRPTGVGFPGEASGTVLPLADWTDTSLATMAYGQGIAVTPLQMAAAYATIANDGRWVRPRLVRGSVDADGRFHQAPASPTRRVVSAATARTVAQMLAYTVDAGTGTGAQVPGYQVAGKTGTARIPNPAGGYYTDRWIASFMGFLPASDPQVVIAAIIDRPSTVYGSIAAAPLFQQVARYAIERLGIAPGRPLPLPPHALPVP
ncbi:MAG: peptidoglycan D,D-transpeptidase FtsI family protein [Candidatus Velamenicoccus archaeovorus]